LIAGQYQIEWTRVERIAGLLQSPHKPAIAVAAVQPVPHRRGTLKLGSYQERTLSLQFQINPSNRDSELGS
jgi:hypothetical protein